MLEDFVVQKGIDPGMGIVTAPEQDHGGDEEDIGPVTETENADKRQEHRQVERDALAFYHGVIGRGGEIVGQHTDAQGGEGPEQRKVEGPPVAPDIHPGVQQGLDHQDGCGEQHRPGQLFVMTQQAVDKIACDHQGGKLPQGVIEAFVEAIGALQQQEVGDLVITVHGNGAELLEAGRTKEVQHAPGQHIQEDHHERQQVVGIDGLYVVHGVVPLAVALFRVAVGAVVELLSQKETGDDEENLHCDGGSGSDIGAEVEERDDEGKDQLQQVKRIDAFHRKYLESKFLLVYWISGGKSMDRRLQNAKKDFGFANYRLVP